MRLALSQNSQENTVLHRLTFSEACLIIERMREIFVTLAEKAGICIYDFYGFDEFDSIKNKKVKFECKFLSSSVLQHSDIFSHFLISLDLLVHKMTAHKNV